MNKWARRTLLAVPLIGFSSVGGWLLVPSKSLPALAQGRSSTTPPSTASPINPRVGGSSNAPPETNPRAPRGVGGLSGQILYEQYCASCHGEDGQGSTKSQGVSLRGVGEAAIDFELTTGRMPRRDTYGGHAEPPYKPTIPMPDIRALDYYISTYISKGGPAIPAVNPAAGDQGHGGELFRQDCAACHSWAGAGGILYTRYVPKITYATPTQVGEAIRVGPDQMPVFGPHEIDQRQLNDIVAYVSKNLEHPYDAGGDALSHIGPIAEGFVALAIGLPLLIFFMRWIGERG